jgi:hypothetical protein
MDAAVLTLLFVGNSLTAANDLPAMVEAMGKASGIAIRAERVAKPDYGLAEHWQDGDARRAIARGGWTLVILQQGPSALPESRVILHDYARRFDREIRRAKGTPAFYAVWPAAARRGDFDRVHESYAGAAALVDGVLLPAGEAWRAAWRRDPGLALYGPDGFHPSKLGTYVAALVIFRGVTGRLPRATAVDGLSERDMAICREAVESLPWPRSPSLSR